MFAPKLSIMTEECRKYINSDHIIRYFDHFIFICDISQKSNKIEF